MMLVYNLPATNAIYPDWKSDCFSTVLAANTFHITKNVTTSKIELIGPMNTMKRAIPLASHFRGCLR